MAGILVYDEPTPGSSLEVAVYKQPAEAVLITRRFETSPFSSSVTLSLDELHALAVDVLAEVDAASIRASVSMEAHVAYNEPTPGGTLTAIVYLFESVVISRVSDADDHVSAVLLSVDALIPILNAVDEALDG